jgi:hypothetical protein
LLYDGSASAVYVSNSLRRNKTRFAPTIPASASASAWSIWPAVGAGDELELAEFSATEVTHESYVLPAGPG